MKYFYLLLLAICPAICFSQDNYLSGYLTKNDGQTLKGYINYSFDEVTPTYISFKVDLAKPTGESYSPGQITAFQIDGKGKYVSYNGRISMDKNRYPMIASSLDTTTTQNSVFLQVVYAGKKVNLLMQNDDLKTRYFIQDDNSLPQELKYYYYFVADLNTNKQVSTYKGQLTLLAQKYNNADNHMMRKLEALDFEKDGLKQVVELIDQGKSADESYVSKFFVGLSVNYNSFKFDGTTPFDQSKSNVTSPGINFGFDFFRPIANAKITLRTEFSFFVAKPRFNAIELQGALSIPTPIRYTFDQYSTSFTPQIIFNIYRHDDFKLFGGLGVAMSYSVFDNNTTNAERMLGPIKFNNFAVAVPARIGAMFGHKFDVTATYCPSQSSTPYSGYSVGYNTFSLGAHYFL